jgi:hypothetical protein
MTLGHLLTAARTWARLGKPRRTGFSFVPKLLCLEDRQVFDATSFGPNGINARGLRTVTGTPLNGENISIGQVEPIRPGRPALGDDAANTHPHVNPE